MQKELMILIAIYLGFSYCSMKFFEMFTVKSRHKLYLNILSFTGTFTMCLVISYLVFKYLLLDV
ncbi:hypothetical protein J2W57_002632 [Chryseobacterium ginsenosidimutans]|uniref:DUF1146 domain-containing protein n=1 Tax=Chryseobacterium geocarposphaerae TaxID=1416776 RepID=A0ABU1LC40_9FLAO|nr:hypothetical protein [Chryseobacterium geocarposphaerae]MDR6699245.1 hypothetical protein [Chryseobacterium ginsenosidimutans]